MDASMISQMRAIKDKNRRLNRIYADLIMQADLLKEALRIQATDGPILILQDTTEFSFKRAAPEKIGFTHTSTGRKMEQRRHQKHAICGLLMHASLAVTPDGLLLRLTAAKFWSRSKFKSTAALKCKINPTWVPIEQKQSMRWLDNSRLSIELTTAPERCVHIGDWESDICKLYCLAQDLGTNFLVRSCVDRLADDGTATALLHKSGRDSCRESSVVARGYEQTDIAELQDYELDCL